MADTKKAAKEAHDLAKEAKAEGGEDPDVALVGAGREAAIERVDEMIEDEAQSRGERSSHDLHPELVGKTYTALHPLNRNHQPVYPGEAVKFEKGEGEHVLDLLAAKAIVEGAPSDEDVKEALGKADLARGRALAG